MWNRSGERGYPCLTPIHTGKTFIFSPFSIKLAVGTSYVMFLGMLGVFAFHLLTFKGQTVIGKLSANNINFRNK